MFTFVGALSAPILGRLGDIFGRVRMLELSLASVVVGCLISAATHSLAMLLAGRALQGVGTSVFSLGFAIARDELPRERRAMGLGVLSATWGLGGGLGLVLSGPVVSNLSYEWIFWLGAIVFAAALVATHLLVPESPVSSRAPVDFVGAALFASGLGSLLLGLSQGLRLGWTSVPIVGLALAGAALLGAWVRWELRTAYPIADLRLLRLRAVWTVHVSQFFGGVGIFMTFVLIPKFVETPESAGYGFGASVTTAGLFMLPWTFAMLAGAVSSGLLANRFGSRVLFQTGMLMGFLAFGLLVVAHDQVWQILVANFFSGLGLGLSHSATANLISHAVPPSQLGEANGMTVIMRGTGNATGTQVAATFVAGSVAAATALPTEHGYTLAFAAGAIAIGIAFAAALTIPRPRRRSTVDFVEAAEVPAASGG